MSYIIGCVIFSSFCHIIISCVIFSIFYLSFLVSYSADDLVIVHFKYIVILCQCILLLYLGNLFGCYLHHGLCFILNCFVVPVFCYECLLVHVYWLFLFMSMVKSVLMSE